LKIKNKFLEISINTSKNLPNDLLISDQHNIQVKNEQQQCSSLHPPTSPQRTSREQKRKSRAPLPFPLLSESNENSRAKTLSLLSKELFLKRK